MLDVKTLKVLEFLNEHPDEAFSIYLMGKCGMTVNFETMQWLTDKNMVYRYEDEDAHLFAYEEPEYTNQCRRPSGAGRARTLCRNGKACYQRRSAGG